MFIFRRTKFGYVCYGLGLYLLELNRLFLPWERSRQLQHCFQLGSSTGQTDRQIDRRVDEQDSQ